MICIRTASTIVLALTILAGQGVFAQMPPPPAEGPREFIPNNPVPNASAAHSPEAPRGSTLTPMPGAAAQAEPASPTKPAPEMSPDAPIMRKPYQPSYGTVPYSVLFSDGTMNEIRNALDGAERAIAEGRNPAPVADMPQPSNAPAQMPVAAASPPPMLNFPVFHVASIVYRSPNDWMLWINGQRVTPKRPFAGIEVVGVVKDRVTLRWPTDNWQYRAQVWNTKSELPKEVARLKSHRSVTRLDADKQALIAELGSNQTLVTSVPLVVEGRHMNLTATMQAPPLPPSNDPQATNPGAVQAIQSQLAEAAREKAEEISEKTKEAALAEEQPPQPNPTPAGNNANQANQPQAGSQPNAQDNLPPSLNDVLNAASNPPRRQGY